MGWDLQKKGLMIQYKPSNSFLYKGLDGFFLKKITRRETFPADLQLPLENDHKTHTFPDIASP